MQYHADGSAVARVWAALALVAATGFGATEPALAADHRVSPGSSTFECNSVKPGDTVTIASGTRGPLRIRNCNGTASNRIVIRNDPNGNGPAVIRQTSGTSGFVFNCNNCVGVDIDGSYKWKGAPGGKTYGIEVTVTGGGGPTAFLMVGGLSRFVTIRNVEIDGKWPAIAKDGNGIVVHDKAIKRSKYPSLWREGILIEDNYIHDVDGEGMYIGANYSAGELPLRNVEIRYNRVEDTGWEGINTKSMWSGNNTIHHNVVRRAGKKTSSTSEKEQYAGIKNNAGAVKIYNNWVEATGQHGIEVWSQQGPKTSEGRGPFEAHIWNNVIVDAGKLWRSFMGTSYGINVGAQSGVEKPIPYIYNNTIVNARQRSINVSSTAGGGRVNDNIVAGTGSNPIISVPGFVQLSNNFVGSISQVGFVNASGLDFRLTVNSPALNKGSSNHPPSDYTDARRPKEGGPDQGAYEGR